MPADAGGTTDTNFRAKFGTLPRSGDELPASRRDVAGGP